MCRTLKYTFIISLGLLCCSWWLINELHNGPEKEDNLSRTAKEKNTHQSYDKLRQIDIPRNEEGAIRNSISSINKADIKVNKDHGHTYIKDRELYVRRSFDAERLNTTLKEFNKYRWVGSIFYNGKNTAFSFEIHWKERDTVLVKVFSLLELGNHLEKQLYFFLDKNGSPSNEKEFKLGVGFWLNIGKKLEGSFVTDRCPLVKRKAKGRIKFKANAYETNTFLEIRCMQEGALVWNKLLTVRLSSRLR